MRPKRAEGAVRARHPHPPSPSTISPTGTTHTPAAEHCARMSGRPAQCALTRHSTQAPEAPLSAAQ